MAPTRPSRTITKKSKSKSHMLKPAKPLPPKTSSQLLSEATTQLEQNAPLEAARLAREALQIAKHDETVPFRIRAAHKILGEIYVELGEIDDARREFEGVTENLSKEEADRLEDTTTTIGTGIDTEEEERAATIVDAYLWLAQLSEEGGEDSVEWYQKGADLLRARIHKLELPPSTPNRQITADEISLRDIIRTAHQRKLSTTLCAIAEVYMTDLSLEPDAEEICEACITEAALMAPKVPDVWQTVANVRISQGKVEEARMALERSLGLWWRDHEDEGEDGDNEDREDKEEEEDDLVEKPTFPTRISLVRLLVEVEMETKAIAVLEEMVGDDDGSVEAWYLGGLAWYTLGEKARDDQSKPHQAHTSDDEPVSLRRSWLNARQWLSQCLQLFEAQQYEDDRLGEHAKELLETVVKGVGSAEANGADEEWEDEDEDENGDEDEKMQE